MIGLTPLAYDWDYSPVSDWWLAGGVSPANCVAAYQPKGAASLAASYTNLANPGFYTASKIAGTEIWSATNGWTFSGWYATTNLSGANSTWSVIIRFANVATGVYTFGSKDAISGARHGIRVFPFSNSVNSTNGNNVLTGINPVLLSGVYCIAGNTAYRNGVVDGTILTSPATNNEPMYLGAEAGGGVSGSFDMYAIAFYDIVLSAAQVAAISSAM